MRTVTKQSGIRRDRYVTGYTRIEKLHRHWTREREYLAPPRTGELAAIDPALIVTPPAGLEIGYVPIATRQAAG